MPYARFRHQPLKGLYLTYQLITTIFIRCPLWYLFSIPTSWRPKASWTLKRSFLVKFYRHLIGIEDRTWSIVKIPDHLAITPGANVNGVWVAPAGHLVTGDLQQWASIANVTSVRVPGYWLHKEGTSIEVASPPQPGEKVLYALHGGGYIKLSAHPSDVTANITKGILQHVQPISRAFSLEYRLAAAPPFTPAHPFPTQLLDAIAGYNYLVNVVGFSPEDIVLEGDSAGGNLALALTRYLTEYQHSTEVDLLGPPGALVLTSPWADASTTHEALPQGSVANFTISDFISDSHGFITYAKKAFTGPHGLSITETNPYISPASLYPGFTVDFKKFPRTFIIGGGAEGLLDSIRTLKNRMIEDLGEGNGVKSGEGKVRYYEAPDAIHDYLIFPWHEPERTDTLKELNSWITMTI